MTYWFSSDYHLGHANIIKYCDRPFESLKEMEDTIVNNHNSRVKPDDTVFFLGDFCFTNSKGGKKGEGEQTKAKEYLKRLNGNFVMVKGNHDANNSQKSCIEGIVIKLGGEEMYLTHKPTNYTDRCRINIVGHVHEAWKKRVYEDTILINVGVDVWDFKPINIQEILREVEKE